MMDKRLKVTSEVLAELRRMKGEEGADASQMIWFLHSRGLPKMGALIALRRANVVPIEDTKAAVHTHDAYVDRRPSDERFEETLVGSVQAIVQKDRVAAA